MGYEQLLNIIKYNIEQELIGREEKENPTVCPVDGWPLKINSRGEKSCPFCNGFWRI